MGPFTKGQFPDYGEKRESLVASSIGGKRTGTCPLMSAPCDILFAFVLHLLWLANFVVSPVFVQTPVFWSRLVLCRETSKYHCVTPR